MADISSPSGWRPLCVLGSHHNCFQASQGQPALPDCVLIYIYLLLLFRSAFTLHFLVFVVCQPLNIALAYLACVWGWIMRVKSLQTSGMLEQFPECGSVANCCHRNLHQKHLLPPGYGCVLKAFLSHVAWVAIWERASSISVQFLEMDF